MRFNAHLYQGLSSSSYPNGAVLFHSIIFICKFYMITIHKCTYIYAVICTTLLIFISNFCQFCSNSVLLFHSIIFIEIFTVAKISRYYHIHFFSWVAMDSTKTFSALMVIRFTCYKTRRAFFFETMSTTRF